MRVLVTGGAGFIGSHFIRLALRDKFKFGIESITALDSLTYAGNLENLSSFLSREDFTFVRGDIRDFELLTALVTQVDVIINFAAESHVDRSISSAAPFISTNVVGTTTLLESLSLNPKCKFVQISTDEVYGSISTGGANEYYPLLPSSPYAASKASADLICLSFKHTFGYDIRITRCTNNYGKNQFPEKLIPLAISKILHDERIPVYGNGSNIRDWISVEDHVDGIRRVLLHGSPGEIYNLGASNELSNLDVLGKILKHLGKGKTSLEFVEDRKGHDLRYALDWTKAKVRLGFEPKANFEIELGKIIDSYM